MELGTALLLVLLCLQLPWSTHSSPLKILKGKSVRCALETNFGGTHVTTPRTFTLGRKLGKGGFGYVIAAKMEKEGSEPAVAAAIKFAKDATDEDALEALKLEQMVYDLLQNKESGFLAYIGGGDVKLGSFGNRFVIVTEMFQMDLWEFADRKSITNEWEKKIFAVEFLMISITMVRSLHELGIVHRDIKPNNFLIRKNPDGSMDLALIDFGVVQLRNLVPCHLRYNYLFSSIANYDSGKQKRLSNPRDDWEGLLYIFCFLVDANEWCKQTESDAYTRKCKFSEYLAKQFESDPILLSALDCMVNDNGYKKWDWSENAKNSFEFTVHLHNLQKALDDLKNRRPKKSSVSYEPGSLQPNQPTLKPLVGLFELVSRRLKGLTKRI